MSKPEKHVFVCAQSRPSGHPRPSCSQKNCTEIADEFYKQLEQSQLFDKIQINTSNCLGPCGAGPSVLVYPEGIMYGNLKKEDVKTIFDQHLVGGAPVSNLKVSKMFWG